jgi:hypothetical protein
MNNSSAHVKFLLSSLLSASFAAIAPASWAHDDCTPYTATFRLEGPTPFGPLNGGGTYAIGDLPPQPAQVAAVMKDSASFDPTSPVTEITFSSMALFAPGADGSLNVLTGIDKSIGTVTGPGTFVSNTKSRITGGSGLFEDVTGRAISTATTTVDLTTGHTVADINVQGKICGISEAGED